MGDSSICPTRGGIDIMQKSEVKKIKSKAKMLMKLDNQIWNKYDWKSGSDVDIEKFKVELRKKIAPSSLSYTYYLPLLSKFEEKR